MRERMSFADVLVRFMTVKPAAVYLKSPARATSLTGRKQQHKIRRRQTAGQDRC